MLRAKPLKRYFLTGILILGPVAMTIAIIRWVIKFVDELFSPLTQDGFRAIPGLGLVAGLALILAVGFIGSHIAGRQLTGTAVPNMPPNAN